MLVYAGDYIRLERGNHFLLETVTSASLLPSNCCLDANPNPNLVNLRYRLHTLVITHSYSNTEHCYRVLLVAFCRVA